MRKYRKNDKEHMPYCDKNGVERGKIKQNNGFTQGIIYKNQVSKLSLITKKTICRQNEQFLVKK